MNIIKRLISNQISDEDLKDIKNAVIKAEESSLGEIITLINYKPKNSSNILNEKKHFNKKRFFIFAGVFLIATFILMTLGLFDEKMKDFFYNFFFKSSKERKIDVEVLLIFLGAIFIISDTLCFIYKKYFRMNTREMRSASEEANEQIKQIYQEAEQKLNNQKPFLIFYVSINERYAQIKCNEVAKSRIKDKEWKKIINLFSKQAKKGNFKKAFSLSITNAARTLKKYFPEETYDPNIIENDMILLSSKSDKNIIY